MITVASANAAKAACVPAYRIGTGRELDRGSFQAARSTCGLGMSWRARAGSGRGGEVKFVASEGARRRRVVDLVRADFPVRGNRARPSLIICSSGRILGQ